MDAKLDRWHVPTPQCGGSLDDLVGNYIRNNPTTIKALGAAMNAVVAKYGAAPGDASAKQNQNAKSASSVSLRIHFSQP